MKTRLALMVLLFAGCDEPDDREAHPIVLPPAEPAAAPRGKSSGEDVSPLSPIVLPDQPNPPPVKAAPPPPPEAPRVVEAEVAAPPAPPAAAVAEEKPVSPEPPKPPVKKSKKKAKR